MNVQWPTGPFMRTFYAALRDLSDLILGGTLVVVDPSIGSRDSKPGFAVFQCGAVQLSGTADIDHKTTPYERCRLVRNWVARLLPTKVGVFAVEAIPKALGHQYTLWAVGATLAGVEATQYIEVPIPFWKAYAKTRKDYVKGDEADARIMGEAMVAWCRESEAADAT